MDALQFGRWLHKRRRENGFSSQRALVERVQQDSFLQQQGISEAFLARLETGQLVHPFRGAVRQRVLALAEILCSTPRDITTYLRAAEIKELDSAEALSVARLHTRLSHSHEHLLHLPMRHRPIFGREVAVQKLLATLRRDDTNVILITGMTGVGKSTLAAEVAHQLAESRTTNGHKFRDGIISFSCTGYQGNRGLLALCEDILALFDVHSIQSGKASSKDKERKVDRELDCDDADIHRAMNQVRVVLATRSLLILLDDLNAHFPLRLALEMLVSQGHETFHTILVTSRYKFASFAHAHHVHLEPLSSAAAFDYLVFLLERSLHEDEQVAAKHLCTLVGYLPSALEAIATLHKTGISLVSLHESLIACSLAPLLENDEELYTRIKGAFASLDTKHQNLFSLLSLVDIPSLGVEAIAALRTTPNAQGPHPTVSLDTSSKLFYANSKDTTLLLPDTVLEMGQFIRHSLLDLQDTACERTTQARYQLHPILRAYGRYTLRQVPQEDFANAQANIRNYALHYIEQHRGDIRRLLDERELLCACCIEALQAERYEDVIQFVTGLTPISCRLNTRKDGTALLRWGIEASQQLHNLAQQVRFMHYYGWLRFQCGDFAEAKQVWQEALAKTEASSLHYWQPLLSLAQLARQQYDGHEAERYVERYLLLARDSATTQNYAYAHILLALYQRLLQKDDAAYKTLDLAAQLLTSCSSSQQHDMNYFTQKLLTIERARILGMYEQTQKECEVLAAVWEQNEEHYDVADLLLEQIAFAQKQQKWEQIPGMVHRSMQAANKVDATYLHARSMQVAQQSKQRYIGVSPVAHN